MRLTNKSYNQNHEEKLTLGLWRWCLPLSFPCSHHLTASLSISPSLVPKMLLLLPGIPRPPHPPDISPYYPLSPGTVGQIPHPLGWLVPQQGQPVYPITTGGFRHPYPTALTVNASMSRWVPRTQALQPRLWATSQKVLEMLPGHLGHCRYMPIQGCKLHSAWGFPPKKILKKLPWTSQVGDGRFSRLWVFSHQLSSIFFF